MSHPYRVDSQEGQTVDPPHCPLCGTWAILTRVRWKAIALVSLAFSFLTANLACAIVTYFCARLTEQAASTRSLIAPAEAIAANRHHGPGFAGPAAPLPPAASSDRMLIAQLDACEFTLSRAALDKVLEGQADLMRVARLVPQSQAGHVIGVRLYGAGPDTLLSALGFENGDILQAINGMDVASPEKALEAYARLRVARDLRVSLSRRGAKVEMRYHLI